MKFPMKIALPGFRTYLFPKRKVTFKKFMEFALVSIQLICNFGIALPPRPFDKIDMTLG